MNTSYVAYGFEHVAGTVFIEAAGVWVLPPTGMFGEPPGLTIAIGVD